MSLLSRADHKDCNSFLHIRDINQFHESNQRYMIFLGVGVGSYPLATHFACFYCIMCKNVVKLL